MNGQDYDITDPGTRGLMMLQAFRGTFDGRDGLMEAYKLGEMERAKRKERVVQQHSMGLLSGMLSGTDPQELAANFPLADTGVMSNLVASKVAEDRANRARQEQEAAQARQEQRAAQEKKDIAKNTSTAVDVMQRLRKSREETSTPPAVPGEMVPTQELGPTPAQPPMGGMGLPTPEPEMTQMPDFQPPDVTTTIPGMPLDQISDQAVYDENPSIDPRALAPARELVRKDMDAERKNTEPETDATSAAVRYLAGLPRDQAVRAMSSPEFVQSVAPGANMEKVTLALQRIWGTDTRLQGSLAQSRGGGAAQGRLNVASSAQGRDQTAWEIRTRTQIAEEFSNSGLPPEVSELLGEVAGLGGRVPLPPYMGRGRSGDETRMQFYTNWYNTVQEQGGAQAYIQNQAALTADKSSLGFQTKRMDSASSFVENLGMQIDRVKDFMGELGRFDTRLLNIPRRELAKTVVGTPFENIVEMYVTEISNEIGKLSTDSIQSVRELSVEAQNKWYKIHDMNLSVADLAAVLEETRHAADMRFGTIQRTREGIKGRIGSGQGSEPQQEGASASGGPREGDKSDVTHPVTKVRVRSTFRNGGWIVDEVINP